MPEVTLLFRDENTKPGFNIGVVLGKKPTAGQVGLEIEVEGKNLPHEDDTPAPWVHHIDHSLRGEENAEYVLKKPVDFGEVPPAISTLWKQFEKNKSVLDDSNRTSVHVHLNCQEFHMNRLTVFMAAWFAVEEALVEWCGQHRVGNLFCLRAVDAPAIINYLRKFIRTDGAYPLNDILHYAALNPNALLKFGSLEFRTLRFSPDPQVTLNWVRILERLYNLSADYKDPREFPAQFSAGGPLSFYTLLLGEELGEMVKKDINWTQEDLVASMMRGIRFAQDLCYARDWDSYKPTVLQPDPFGRDARKIAAKLSEPSEPVVGSPLNDLGDYIAASGSDEFNVAWQQLQEMQAEQDQQEYTNFNEW
jgi:hypothetical protein